VAGAFYEGVSGNILNEGYDKENARVQENSDVCGYTWTFQIKKSIYVWVFQKLAGTAFECDTKE
jgi:hypothetical protein